MMCFEVMLVVNIWARRMNRYARYDVAQLAAAVYLGKIMDRIRDTSNDTICQSMHQLPVEAKKPVPFNTMGYLEDTYWIL